MNVTTRPFTPDELKLLLMRSRLPWKAIYYIAVYSGLRISDLIRLPWSADPPLHSIVEKKTGKSKVIFWSDPARSLWFHLYKYGRPRSFLFPGKDPSTYRKHLQLDCARFNISLHAISFHSFRKTHATILFRNHGILVAQKSLNHSSLSTTSSYVENALIYEQLSCFDEFVSNSTGVHHG